MFINGLTIISFFMQSVLIKHCKPNEFLDSSGCLAFISVCFMFILWFNFFFIFIYSVPTIAQLLHTLVRSVVSSSLSEP